MEGELEVEERDRDWCTSEEYRSEKDLAGGLWSA